jgi:hypothetical protein
MTRQVVHLMRKDVLEHRTWLAAFLGLTALRAALVGSGIDSSVRDRDLLMSLSLGHLLLTIVHGSLLVALAVQLVQADRPVGTTAFWLTRPIRRADLVVAKLATATLALVVFPALVDALVAAFGGLSWRAAVGPVAEGVVMRLAVALPVMAFASVTSDLAGFVVSAVAVFIASLVVEAVFQWGKLVPLRSMAAAYSATVVVAGVLIVGTGATFAHQVFTRRRARTVGVMCLVGLSGLVVANRWTQDFLSRADDLEAGWLDPARVTLTMTPLPAERVQGSSLARPWLARASWALAGAPPNAALALLTPKSVAVFPDGTKQTHGAAGPPSAWRTRWQSHVYSKNPVEALLGGVRLLDAPEVPERGWLWPLAELDDGGYRQYAENRIRFEVDATLGAVGYRVGAVLPLDAGATGTAGDGRFSILSANCEAGRCTVVLRDVMPASLIEIEPRSRVFYVLVNKARGLALLNGEQDYPSRIPVFGSAPILTEHVRVTHHRLVFHAPEETPDAVDASWQQGAAIAAVEMRNVGTFRVRTVVAGTGSDK